MMLSHHGALDKLKLFHLEDGGFHHQRDYKLFDINFESILNINSYIKALFIQYPVNMYF